jgi:hypothetical protein
MLGLDICPRALPALLGLVEGYLTGKGEILGAWNGAPLLMAPCHGLRLPQLSFSHTAPMGGCDQDSVDSV